MDQKKVIIFLSSLENGGTERQARLLVPCLVKNNYAVTIVAYHRGIDQYAFRELNIDIKVLSKSKLRPINRILVAIYLLTCFFKMNTSFLFLTETYHPYLKLTDIGKTIRRRSVFSIRKALDKLKLNNTDLDDYRCVHVQTDLVKKQLSKLGVKTTVIRNMFYVPKQNNPEIANPRVFIVVGRHDNDKGVLELCEYLVKNKSKITNAVVHIWGKGVDTNKIKDLLLVNQPVPLVYCGVYTDLESVMNGCVALISNSYSEGFPNVIDEAIIRGIPVIYRREEKASAELLADYKNSYPFSSFEHVLDIIENKSLSRCNSIPIERLVKENKEISGKWVRLLHS